MVRAASFVSGPENKVLPDARPANNHAMDKVMTDLALAFDLDINLANAEAEEAKWPMGRSLAFAVLTSAALWALIAGVIALI